MKALSVVIAILGSLGTKLFCRKIEARRGSSFLLAEVHRFADAALADGGLLRQELHLLLGADGIRGH